MAPEPSVCADPANSERMSTPRLRCWQATYSKAFAFIPSRSDVIIITSAYGQLRREDESGAWQWRSTRPSQEAERGDVARRDGLVEVVDRRVG